MSDPNIIIEDIKKLEFKDFITKVIKNKKKGFLNKVANELMQSFPQKEEEVELWLKYCMAFRKFFLKEKSIYLIGNNYNCFYSLAEALNKRGWNAISMNPYGESQFIQNYHEAIDIANDENAIDLFIRLLLTFKVVHVYNRTYFSIYNGSKAHLYKILSVENLRKAGILFLYTPSGCLDGSTSQEITFITKGLCDKCIWQSNDAVCHEPRNIEKRNWLRHNCDVYCNAVDLPKTLAFSGIGLNIPIEFAMNSKQLSPEIEIPSEFILEKKPNDLIIFTAFGDEANRVNSEKDIKGKKHIISAINQLKAEGHPIIHFHANNILAKNMKFYQVQADIIVDQLNYGSVGSSAREGMILGRPVICHISQVVRDSNLAMKHCPAVDATEENVYDVLKSLVIMSHDDRKSIGEKSRRWVIEWFDADISAKRYEKVIKAVKNKQPLQPFEQFI